MIQQPGGVPRGDTRLEALGWTHVYSGKVRDLYTSAAAPDRVLVVASDRVSAFDHVLEPSIPNKGALLTQLSLWWFGKLGMRNHLAAAHPSLGEHLPPGIAEGFYGRYGVRPLSVYHSTQAGPLAIDRAGREPGTVGRAMDQVELRVAASDGGKLSAGTIGPLWARSKALSTLAVPKIRLPARDGEIAVGGVDGDGWFRTGDLGQLDRAGRVTLNGREGDLVKVDGKRMALSEVAVCLQTFPRVKAAKVRIVTDDLGGPMVVAQVVRAGTCKAEDLIDHCARNLAPYKVPRQIEFCEQV